MERIKTTYHGNGRSAGTDAARDAMSPRIATPPGAVSCASPPAHAGTVPASSDCRSAAAGAQVASSAESNDVGRAHNGALPLDVLGACEREEFDRNKQLQEELKLAHMHGAKRSQGKETRDALLRSGQHARAGARIQQPSQHVRG